MSQLGSIFFSSESWTFFQQSCQILIEGFRLNLRIWPYFQRVYIHLIKEGPSLFLLQVYFGGVQRFVVYFQKGSKVFFVFFSKGFKRFLSFFSKGFKCFLFIFKGVPTWKRQIPSCSSSACDARFEFEYWRIIP